MTQSIWSDEDTARFLRLRVKTFYNPDYFERIVLPLLDIPSGGQVLDVGCGYGGLSLMLAQSRPDLQISGVDPEIGALEGAASIALQEGLVNLRFQPGDGQRLEFPNNQFDAVVCQTVLTHVREAVTVISEMTRVLKSGGVFMAAEYTDLGAWTKFDNQGNPPNDESWHQKYFRVARLFMRGKRSLGRGDDQLGIQIPALLTTAGLEVFDVRLNDRALHIIPPYRYPKQQDYVELLKAFYAPDPEHKGLARNIETLSAVGGSAEEAEWLFNVNEDEAVRKALDEGTLSMVSAFMLFLTFAKKPVGS